MAKTGTTRNPAPNSQVPKKVHSPPIYKPVKESQQAEERCEKGHTWRIAEESMKRERRPSRLADTNERHPRLMKLWDENDVPQHIRDELLPAFDQILQNALDHQNEYSNFLSYNIYWHPTCPDSIRKRYAKYYCHSHPRTALISPMALAKIIYYLRGQTQVMQLLADRGPDFGLTLLMLLDIVFQVAFCMRRTAVGAKDTKRNMSMVVVHCPRILEVLSLHLDCSPLAPNFLDKYLLTCEGFLFHRKLPNAALPRFYQLQYFLSPESRPFLFKSCFEWPDTGGGGGGGDGGGSSQKVSPEKDYLPSPLREVVENKLWNLARYISLGRPSPEARLALSSGLSRQIMVNSYLDAMAVVFERLNHVARAIFGTPICSYGSAATGFATKSSDVDVVLQLGTSGVTTMLTQARKLRDSTAGLDLNPFPSKTQGGFTQAVGDWSWISEKEPTVAAAIWAGRLFAWAVHRLYGWHVQCVQSAYVPIVRILGCVGPDGLPHAVPDKLRPYSSVEASVGTAVQSIIKQNLNMPGIDSVMLGVEDPGNIFSFKTVSPSQRQMLCKLCAVSVVAECQYASWSPALAEGMDTIKCAAYLGGRLTGEEDKAALEAQLFEMAMPSFALPTLDNAPLLGLEIPRVNEVLNDGRLNIKCLPPPSGDEIWLVEADFSADRQVGIHNSRLLRAYASCSPFVVALGLLVKHWAKNRGIGDAYAGYLSGYQWTLLVIHYLQHFFCVTPPQTIAEHPEYLQLQRQMRQAGLPVLNYLPLLPNLQHPVKQDPSQTLQIHEMEGPVEVSFFQPGSGCNRNLPRSILESCRDKNDPADASEPCSPRQREWPEDRLLKADPLMYAYEQLTPPFDLKPMIASGMTDEALTELWLLRVHTAPRSAASGPRRKGKNELNTNYQLWDARRQQSRNQLLQDPPGLENHARKRGSEAGMSKLLPFPSLSSIRSRTFISDHVMVKGRLLIPFGSELTLTELLYGFFEYYGLRFNYATDMADIDRVPELPRGKKEFFETGLFTPKVFEIAPFSKEEDFRIIYPIIVSETESREEPRVRPKRTDETESAPEDSLVASRRDPLSTTTAAPGSKRSTKLASPSDKDVIAVSPSPTFQPQNEGEVSEAEEEGIAHEDGESTHVTHTKEVIGRGNGPYQYRGRHFLCIRDPFEKLRTIGPPCRCQTHISTELIIALQLFGMMRADLRKNEDNISRVQSAVDQLFSQNAHGLHPVGRVWHPVVESLGQALSRLQHEYSSNMDGPDNHRGSIYQESMYPGLVSTVLSNGKYKSAFAAYEERLAETQMPKAILAPPPPRDPVIMSPELDSVSQEPTNIPRPPSGSFVTPERTSTPLIPQSIPTDKRQEEVDINCVPPGFEEHSPSERKPFSLQRDPPSPIIPPVQANTLDEDTRRIIEDHFTQCPHFVLNYGEYQEQPKSDMTPWRYSEEAVHSLKLLQLCTCQQHDRSRPRTNSRHSKANSSPQIDPQTAQAEPQGGGGNIGGNVAGFTAAEWIPRDNAESISSTSDRNQRRRQQHQHQPPWTAAPQPQRPPFDEMNTHFASAQLMQQNLAALMSRSLYGGLGPEEARHLILSMLWGGTNPPGFPVPAENPHHPPPRPNPHEGAQTAQGRRHRSNRGGQNNSRGRGRGRGRAHLSNRQGL